MASEYVRVPRAAMEHWGCVSWTEMCAGATMKEDDLSFEAPHWPTSFPDNRPRIENYRTNQARFEIDAAAWDRQTNAAFFHEANEPRFKDVAMLYQQNWIAPGSWELPAYARDLVATKPAA